MSIDLEQKYNQEVVVIGGGSGPYNLLKGLVAHNNPEKITSIYTTWDDGGSTGKLRTEWGILPPGDARRQLIALIPDPIKQQIIYDIFQHRISVGGVDGEGHAFGNLMLAVFDQIYQDEGMKMLRNLLDVKSETLGVTTNALTLAHKDLRGKEFFGEHYLDDRGKEPGFDPDNRISSIFFITRPRVNSKAVEAIGQAKKIVFSSGSLFGSSLPFLLVPEFRAAIDESSAELFVVLNVMTELGQTDGFKASAHLREYNRYLRNPDRVNWLIAHENHIHPNVLKVYKREKQIPVVIDEEECKQLSPKLRIIKGQLANNLDDEHLVRHDPDKVALAVLDPEYAMTHLLQAH